MVFSSFPDPGFAEFIECDYPWRTDYATFQRVLFDAARSTGSALSHRLRVRKPDPAYFNHLLWTIDRSITRATTN